MFFGKPSKPEDVNSDQLVGLLNSLFDKKMESLDSRTSSIARDLQYSKSQFEKACDDFEKLEAEPDMENLYITNTSSLKIQKATYAKALKRIIHEGSREIDAPNIYMKYKRIMSNEEQIINEILKANANYKMVVFTYSNYLGQFKKAFSNIEHNFNLMKSEIESKGDDWSKYTVILAQVEKLNSLDEEIQTMSTSIADLEKALDSHNKKALSEDEKTLEGKLLAKKLELSLVNSDISFSISKMTALTAPLERPARKFDHLSVRKRHLSDFIKDPFNSISSESDYKDFKALLEEMTGSLTNLTDQKDYAKTSSILHELVGYNMYDAAVAYKALVSKKSYLEEEVRAFERLTDGLKTDKNAALRYRQDTETMKRSLEDIKKVQASTKVTVERFFLDYYKKRIHIN